MKRRRSQERRPTKIRVRLQYRNIDAFIHNYAVNISRGGIFIVTKTPHPVETVLSFEFLLTPPGDAATSIIRGEGIVQWIREYDETTPDHAYGMGVKFTYLDAESRALIERVVTAHLAVKAGGESVDQWARAWNVSADQLQELLNSSSTAVDFEEALSEIERRLKRN